MSDYLFRQLFERESYTYTYLIADLSTKQAILVDPVLEQVERDFQLIKELGLTLAFCSRNPYSCRSYYGRG